MIEKVTELFNSTGKPKVEFKPEIKIACAGNHEPLWIDCIFKLRNNLMVKVSNRENNSINMSLAALDQSKLLSICDRLQALASKTKTNGKS
jgi:hypothetical protein